MHPSAKVFGIGLSKTGTSSLNDALNQLGIRSIHYPADPTTLRQLASADYRLDVLDRYQGATDISVSPFFPQLDQQYPGSKFILTVREIESWLTSIELHWEGMLEWGERDHDFWAFTEFITACVYGSRRFHRDRFAYAYQQHTRAVESYFAERPDDLLVMDICRGDGWEVLCPFLGVATPNSPFPHANRQEEAREHALWIEKVDQAIKELQQAVPPSACYVLIDDSLLAGTELSDPRRTCRLEAATNKPLESSAAIVQLEQLHAEGVEYVVVAWPSFWWREYYADLGSYFSHQYELVSDTPRLVVFQRRDVQGGPVTTAAVAGKQDVYTPDYFSRISSSSRPSAEVIAPWIIDLLRPHSVVDVGCGTGAWLAAFTRHGVAKVLGIDGDYVDRSTLSIGAEEFRAADISQPLAVRERFDLALSLEVAEHLAPDEADQFVETLAKLVPAVLFSAAVPQQGGERHVNEQWPNYWTQRFARYELYPVDVVRPRFWNDTSVEWWYAQNMMLFLAAQQATEVSQRWPSWQGPGGEVPSLVHPANFLHQAWQNRVLQCAVDLVAVVPSGRQIVLVDEARFGQVLLPGRTVVPFPSIDGEYGGPPRDDTAAVAELKTRIAQGADFLAFGWPAFWWLDHYARFAQWLARRFPLVLENDRLRVFRLRSANTPLLDTKSL